MATSHTLLEQELTGTISKNLPLSFNTSSVPSLFASTAFIYVSLVSACVVATVAVLARGSFLRIQASEAGIRKSKEEWRRGSLGLLGVLLLFVILYTLNRDLLVGDVGLDGLRVSRGVYTNGNMTFSPSGTSRACESKESVVSSLSSPSGLCGNTTCSVLSGCNYQKYLATIKEESLRQGVDYKMVVVVMCKESNAIETATPKPNPDGTYDCGLMQINQKTPCTPSVLNPQANIAMGVNLLKEKMNSSSASRIYTGVPQKGGVFASYNCCSNGTIPNDPSTDCTQSSGFAGSIPKWACPINPGTSEFNMCGVKAYACELVSCLNSVP